MKKISFAFLLMLTLTACTSRENKSEIDTEAKMTETEAREIAEASCIKGGDALGTGTYNENSKTWWFDANLNAIREGCSPACVVSEKTQTAEINWRCAGLIEPEQSTPQNSPSNAMREQRVLLDSQSLPRASNPSPNAMLVTSKLCNLVKFNNEAANAIIPYNNPEMGISFDLPYNENWGDENFKITPYNAFSAGIAVTDNEDPNSPLENTVERIEFGPITNESECYWPRMYGLSFETAKNTQDVINSININGQLALAENPVALKINDLDVVKYTTQGVYLVPTIEVIGKNYNYKFYIQSTDTEKDFQTLESIIKTIKLIDQTS